MKPGHFELLLDRFHSGEATPAEIADLQQILRAEPHKRRQLVERFLLEVHLHKAFSGMAPTATISRIIKWGRVGKWAAAAAILLAVGLFLLLYLGGKRGPAEVLISKIESGQIQINGVVAQQIPPKTPFVVAGETAARVRLPDGSQAELETETHAIIHGQVGELRLVEITQGGGKFSVVKGQGQFRVQTPVGHITVLGTEFTAQLTTAEPEEEDAEGKLVLVVTVLSGEVQVQSGGRNLNLTAGKSHVFLNQQEKEDKGTQKTVEDPDKEAQEIAGILKAVDRANNTLTLTRKGEDKDWEQTFQLQKNVKVLLGKKMSRLGDLKTGMDLLLKRSEDRKTIVEIRERKDILDENFRFVKGMLQVVSPTRNTITLFKREKGPFASQTYELLKDVSVVVGTREGKLTDLRLGMDVLLKLSEERKGVVEIRASGMGIGGKKGDKGDKGGKNGKGGVRGPGSLRAAVDVPDGLPGENNTERSRAAYAVVACNTWSVQPSMVNRLRIL